MKTGEIQPQMLEMNADVFSKSLFFANMCNLRLTRLAANETDKALREILEKIEV